MSTAGRKIPANAARNAVARAERLDALVKVLGEFPEGVSKAALAATMRLNVPTVVGRLRMLRAGGVAVWVTVPGGSNSSGAARWALAQHRATAEAAATRAIEESDARVREQRKAQDRLRTAERQAEQERQELEAQEAFERGTARVVSAAQAGRFVTTAPNSVWQVAAGVR